MKSDIAGFVNRIFLTLVPQTKGHCIVTCCWHLKKKSNLDGTLKKSKACLTNCTFKQQQRVDYNKTLAPYSRQESLENFLAINSLNNWEVMQLDVVVAFLYGSLNGGVYLAQPEEYVDKTHADHV